MTITQSDIIGLTLAELAFLLLFGLSVPAMVTQEQLGEAQARADSAEAVADSAEAVADSLKRELRSRFPPKCTETGLERDTLFVTTVAGADAFAVGSRIYTLRSLLSRHRMALDQARDRGCRYFVQVYFRPEVETPEYNLALRRLRVHFYTDLRGSEE